MSVYNISLYISKYISSIQTKRDNAIKIYQNHIKETFQLLHDQGYYFYDKEKHVYIDPLNIDVTNISYLMNFLNKKLNNKIIIRKLRR